MKIGSWNISFSRTQVSEKFKAAYEPAGASKPKRTAFYPGQYSWKSRCAHYDKLTDSYSLAKVAPFTLAGLTTAQGVYFTPALNRDDETYTLAKEAKYEADRFKREQNLNSLFYDTVWRCAKYGGCFWEISTDPVYSIQIPTLQECIEPASADEQGNITSWRQVVNGAVTAEWTSNELVLVPFLGVTTQTWPYAPSIFTGLEAELEMLTGIEESAKDYSEKQAWPYELLQLGDAQNPISDDEYNQARSEWKNRKPGEGIVSTVPSDIKAGGTGSAPIRELAVLCNLMKDNVQDAVMIAPISKLYNATEASAKVLVQQIMTVLGQPIQWRIASCFELYVLKPYLESRGYSRKSCPQTVFEVPDVHKKEEMDFWVAAVTAKLQSPVQACEHMNLEYDEAWWIEQERKQQEQMQQQVVLKQANTGKPQPVQAKPAQKAGEKWFVERIPDSTGS
jgi:hypothetical protein